MCGTANYSAIFRKSMGVDYFHLTFDLETSGSRSKVKVSRACDPSVKATVAWNMMTAFVIFGPTLTNGVKVKL